MYHPGNTLEKISQKTSEKALVKKYAGSTDNRNITGIIPK